MKIKLNLIAEIDAPNVMVARRKLDAFREAVLPSDNYGISLYENHAEECDRAASWLDCCRAARRLADMVCIMYHPRDEKARQTWPTATWAEIIASELGIEIPGRDE